MGFQPQAFDLGLCFGFGRKAPGFLFRAEADQGPPAFLVRIWSEYLHDVVSFRVGHAVCIVVYSVFRERLEGSVLRRELQSKGFDDLGENRRSSSGYGRQRGSDILDRRPVTLGGRQGVTRATFRLSVFDDPDCSTLVSLLPISCSVIRSSPVPVPPISAQIDRHATLRVLAAALGAQRLRLRQGHGVVGARTDTRAGALAGQCARLGGGLGPAVRTFDGDAVGVLPEPPSALACGRRPGGRGARHRPG